MVKVLSTTSGTPASLATAETAAMSVMMPPGIGDQLDEDRLGLRRKRRAEALGIVGIGEAHVPVEFLEGVGELVDRAAIELARGDELIARLHQRMEHDRLRRVPRGDGERGRAPLQGRDALLEHSLHAGS